MKQKIAIRLPLRDDKCRSKAMKIAVGMPGVESAAVEGVEKDQLVVVGDEIDSVKMARRLRKKFGHSELVSIGAADAAQPGPPPPAAEPQVVGVVATPYYGFPQYHQCEIREPSCSIRCTIM